MQVGTTGAAKMRLFWKTPGIFAEEQRHESKKRVREVYLPANTVWHDFWTGKTFKGRTRITVDAPIDKIPLLIKGGSIIPMGPFLQYSTEKPADPIELRIYPGADGQFILYEDENDKYDYEKGIHATITFVWNNAQRTLTISDRQGGFPGMLRERTFNVVVVSQGHGTGVEISGRVDKSVQYSGKSMTVELH